MSVRTAKSNCDWLRINKVLGILQNLITTTFVVRSDRGSFRFQE